MKLTPLQVNCELNWIVMESELVMEIYYACLLVCIVGYAWKKMPHKLNFSDLFQFYAQLINNLS